MAFWNKQKKMRRELAEAAEALEQDELSTAISKLLVVVEYPAKLESEQEWIDAFGLFAKIAEAKGAEELAKGAEEAAANPGHPRVLYELGYQLFEQKLFGFAAAVLARADAAQPGEEEIVTELALSLEAHGNSVEACRRLRASGLVESSWLCRYLLAFNSIMSADLAEARAQVPALLADPGDHLAMAQRIEGMVARAAALEGLMPLDADDLRGWHFAINGALLLHRSPHGFHQGMRGRYAYVQDSPQLARQGLRSLAAALEAMQLRPSRIYLLDDRESQILGLAAATLLELPAVPWHRDEEGQGAPEEPGLIVAYDLDSLDGATLTSLRPHRPGQILFAHASSWTEPPPFTADLTTYLYQSNVSPWGEQIFFDPASAAPRRAEPRQESAETLAAELLAAAAEDASGDDDAPSPAEELEQLRTLAAAIAPMPAHGPGATQRSGPRRRQWAESPVRSNRFR